MTQIYKIAILLLAGLNLARTVVKTDLTIAIFVAAVIVLLFGIIVMGKGKFLPPCISQCQQLLSRYP